MADRMNAPRTQDDSLEILVQKRHEIEKQLSDLLTQRKKWKMKETELNNILLKKTGELAVLSEFFNYQVKFLGTAGGMTTDRRSEAKDVPMG